LLENRVKQLEEENANLEKNLEILEMIYDSSCDCEAHLKDKFSQCE